MRLELPDTLARQAELVADLVQRLRLTGQAVVMVDNQPLAVGQLAERVPDEAAATDALELVPGRLEGAGIGDQVAEFGLLAVRAEELVELNGGARNAQRLLDLVGAETRCRDELVARLPSSASSRCVACSILRRRSRA